MADGITVITYFSGIGIRLTMTLTLTHGDDVLQWTRPSPNRNHDPTYASYACTPPMCALWAVMLLIVTVTLNDGDTIIQ